MDKKPQEKIVTQPKKVMVWRAIFEVNSNIGDLAHFMAELPVKKLKNV